ncbi:MAG: DUF2723 domain-containing protein [Pseudomonadales bacterium]|nr:DUF2723 domain-containing protein [Pseudomonadales bacterium]
MPYHITMEDAGLFQMVCHLNGISHPPGYPLFTLMCQQLMVLPHVVVGNLVSVLFAVCTLVVFYKVVILLSNNPTVALIAALAYGLCICFWSQAIIIEVYSLAALTFMLCWWQLLKFYQTSKIRYWFGLCLFGGLALSNHWPLFILSAAGFIVHFWYMRSRFWQLVKSPYVCMVSLGLLLVGLTPYLSIVFNTNPEIAIFGSVESDRFWPYVLRSYYSDDQAAAVFADKLKYYVWLIQEMGLQLGLAALPVILTGVFLSRGRLGTGNTISLGLIFFATTFGLMTLLNMQFDVLYQAVFQPYPVIACAALAIWFALGVHWLSDQLGSRFGVPKKLVVSLLFITIALSNFPKVNRNLDIAGAYAETVLESLPPEAILFVSGDNHVGPLGFKNRVEMLRADVTLYSRESLVFSNRLSSAWSSQADIDLAIGRFIGASKRPVFSIVSDDLVTADYGLYYGYGVNDGTETIFVPEFEAYVDYILDLYIGNFVTDLHEWVFCYNVIAKYSKYYARYGFMTGTNQLSDLRRLRIDKLLSTLPGKLATIETSFSFAAKFDANKMLEMVRAAESQLTSRTPRREVSLLYQYFGLIHMLRQEDQLAVGKFQKSLMIMPHKENKSICYLRTLYARVDAFKAITRLEDEYTFQECGA